MAEERLNEIKEAVSKISVKGNIIYSGDKWKIIKSVYLRDIMVKCGACESISKAKALLSQKAVRLYNIDNSYIGLGSEDMAIEINEKEFILNVGKKFWIKIVMKN